TTSRAKASAKPRNSKTSPRYPVDQVLHRQSTSRVKGRRRALNVVSNRLVMAPQRPRKIRMRTWGIRATPKVVNTRGTGTMNTISLGRRTAVPLMVPVAMAAAASAVISKFNRKISPRADKITDRVDNKASRVKGKERKAKARLHLPSNQQELD